MDNISLLMKELDKAVLLGDTEKAQQISEKLFYLQGGKEEDAIMPDQFMEKVKDRKNKNQGGQKSMSMKKIISFVAIAAVMAAFSITAIASRWSGIKDMVFNNNDSEVVEQNLSNTNKNVNTDGAIDVDSSISDDKKVKTDLIALQGYPESKEYKASVEWNLFCSGYDTDHKILDSIGNGSNEISEKYPLYFVYTQEMANKLEEIIAKHELTLHNSITIVEKNDELLSIAGTGDFIGNTNTVLGGYVYDDGTFHYDGEAILKNTTKVSYQFGNYAKGTFSDTYLNIGDANEYIEWSYKTASGVEVSLALGEKKALVIADLDNSYVTINVLSGTSGEASSESSSLTKESLQEFADSFDYSKMN